MQSSKQNVVFTYILLARTVIFVVWQNLQCRIMYFCTRFYDCTKSIYILRATISFTNSQITNPEGRKLGQWLVSIRQSISKPSQGGQNNIWSSLDRMQMTLRRCHTTLTANQRKRGQETHCLTFRRALFESKIT